MQRSQASPPSPPSSQVGEGAHAPFVRRVANIIDVAGSWRPSGFKSDESRISSHQDGTPTSEAWYPPELTPSREALAY
jgi:hypothetical protein